VSASTEDQLGMAGGKVTRRRKWVHSRKKILIDGKENMKRSADKLLGKKKRREKGRKCYGKVQKGTKKR